MGASLPEIPVIASPLGGQRTKFQPSIPKDFFEILRVPDAVTVQTETEERRLLPGLGGRWQSGDVTVIAEPRADGAVQVSLSAPKAPVKRLHLRWNGRTAFFKLVLGDAWERAYGDLEWVAPAAERILPWYFAAWDGKQTHGYGVHTGATAFCHWQIDADGVSLWADVRSGGAGVRLGERTLEVCQVICRVGAAKETPAAAVHAFCKLLCPQPRLPRQPVYGHNDWYYAYGHNSAVQVLEDAHRIVGLAPSGTNRPFVVIDDGWQADRSSGGWDVGSAKFPDLPGLAAEIKHAGARPGIWMRPLLAEARSPRIWRLSRDHAYLDPTVEGVRRKVKEDIARLRGWGFEMIKHDYSTFDILGRWGFQLGANGTADGWTFAAGAGKTTVEVISQLYTDIRTAAGDGLVLGCNTVSHLSAGVFELCRIGDDTSGQEWARTRKMGVNCLAFRAAQHGAFYAADPDCVGVTPAISWELNRQWLDLVARSGTALFVSLDPKAVGAEQERDLRAALAIAAAPQPLGEPLDWQSELCPTRWRLMGRERQYHW